MALDWSSNGVRTGAIDGAASSIVDLTGTRPRLVRAGSVPTKEILELLPALQTLD